MGLRDTLKRIITGPEPGPARDLGRNDRCWCGSGHKYKACHLAADEQQRSSRRSAAVRRGPARRF